MGYRYILFREKVKGEEGQIKNMSATPGAAPPEAQDKAAFFTTAATTAAVNDAVRAVCQDVLGGEGGGSGARADDTKREDSGNNVPALDYSPKMVEAAVPRLSGSVVKAVQALDEARAFKFIASVMLAENSGCGLHKGSAALWNAETDSSCVVRWENASLIVVVTIFAVAV